MLPEMVLYAAVPSAMPTRIQSRAAGASHTLYSSLWRSLKRRRTTALPLTVVGSSSMSARPFSRTSTCGSREPVERIWLSLSCSTSHQRAVRRIDAEVRDRARARRLAVLVEHAQRDHRARAAIGDELRGFLVDLGAHRAAAVVHRALGLPDHLAVGVENARGELVVAVDQVDAAPAAQRHRVGLVEARRRRSSACSPRRR